MGAEGALGTYRGLEGFRLICNQVMASLWFGPFVSVAITGKTRLPKKLDAQKGNKPIKIETMIRWSVAFHCQHMVRALRFYTVPYLNCSVTTKQSDLMNDQINKDHVWYSGRC